MIGVQDVFGQSGKPDELLEAYGLTAEAIAEAVRKMIGKS
jgi:transketolase